MDSTIKRASFKTIWLVVSFTALLLIYCNWPVTEEATRQEAERRFLVICNELGYDHNAFTGPIITGRASTNHNWFTYEWRDTTPGSDFKVQCLVDRWGAEATFSGKGPRKKLGQ